MKNSYKWRCVRYSNVFRMQQNFGLHCHLSASPVLTQNLHHLRHTYWFNVLIYIMMRQYRWAATTHLNSAVLDECSISVSYKWMDGSPDGVRYRAAGAAKNLGFLVLLGIFWEILVITGAFF